MLEARSKGRTTDALKSLMKAGPPDRPPCCGIWQRGHRPHRAGAPGATSSWCGPGENIPVDGPGAGRRQRRQRERPDRREHPGGQGPRGRRLGRHRQPVGPFLRCEATRVGEDHHPVPRFIRMVSDAAATKAPIAKIADRVSGVFVPRGHRHRGGSPRRPGCCWAGDLAFALARGISVLVISCPCALGLAHPRWPSWWATGWGPKTASCSRRAASLEAGRPHPDRGLDKTGTITRGEPEVTDLLPAEGVHRGRAADPGRRPGAKERASPGPGGAGLRRRPPAGPP